MSALGDWRADLAAKLVAAGLPATLDPAASPPFVLVAPGDWIAASGVGAWSCSVPVVVATPPPGDAGQLAWLEDTAEAVYAVAGFPTGGAFHGTYAPNDQAPALPAYTLTYLPDVPNPAC